MHFGIDKAKDQLVANHVAGCDDVMVIVSDAGVPFGQRLNAVLSATSAKAANITIMGVSTPPYIDGDSISRFRNLIVSPGFVREASGSDSIGDAMVKMIFDHCYTLPPVPDPPPAPPDYCRSPLSTDGNQPDLGDAPDSTNHSAVPMHAYPSVTAHFPTVFDPATGTDVGPKHNDPAALYLGARASREVDADLLPDDDDSTNLAPVTDRADRDAWDDGIRFPVYITACVQSTLSYSVTVPSGMTSVYQNVWFDFNHDGDWSDTLTCTDSEHVVRSVPEWAVPNQLVTGGAGTYTVTTPQFWGYVVDDPSSGTDSLWMRVSVSEQAAPSPGDGRGPSSGYAKGETEDYLIGHDQDDPSRFYSGVEP